MIKLLSAVAFLFVALHAAAQDRIDAERPGESKTPELVKGNHLQVETGFRSEKLGDNDYLAEYNGVRCHAIYNPFVNRFYVDDKYGVIKDKAPGRDDSCR